jgi:hypothetical protein
MLLAAPSLPQHRGDSQDDDEPDDTEHDCSENRRDARGGEEPDDRAGAAHGARRGAGTDQAETGFGVG